VVFCFLLAEEEEEVEEEEELEEEEEEEEEDVNASMDTNSRPDVERFLFLEGAEATGNRSLDNTRNLARSLNTNSFFRYSFNLKTWLRDTINTS
jgi:hypothetical protein